VLGILLELVELGLYTLCHLEVALNSSGNLRVCLRSIVVPCNCRMLQLGSENEEAVSPRGKN
jgi:hypothetical protein